MRKWYQATDDELSDVYTPVVTTGCYSSITLTKCFGTRFYDYRLFRLDYCTSSYAFIVPFRPSIRIVDQNGGNNLILSAADHHRTIDLDRPSISSSSNLRPFVTVIRKALLRQIFCFCLPEARATFPSSPRAVPQ